MVRLPVIHRQDKQAIPAHAHAHARSRMAAGVAGSLWGLTALFAVGSLVLGFLSADADVKQISATGSAVGEALLSLVFLVFPTFGALIAARQPRNVMGWLFCAIGLIWAAKIFGFLYGVRAVIDAPGSLPGGSYAVWLENWDFLPGLASIALLLLLFPTGRFFSPRWMLVAWAGSIGVASAMTGLAFQAGPLDNSISPVENPLGVFGSDSMISTIGVNVGLPLFVLANAAAPVSVVVRLRRSSGIERQQLKWIALASGVVGVAIAFDSIARQIAEPLVPLSQLLFVFSLVLIPVAAGIAVLRYRMWDIDRLINRALVYAILTVMLGGTYVLSILVLQRTLDPITGDSNLAVAASTLLLAALARPLRRRIQDSVDRRFYRTRYDAVYAVERFSLIARNEVDLENLTSALTSVVQETVQPARISLWLRD